MTTAQLTSLAKQFMKEYGQRFSMDFPEDAVLESVPTSSEEGIRMRVPYLSVEPKGQFLSIIKDLKVRFTFMVDRFDRVTVEVHSSYDHIGGGSNGYRVDYPMILSKERALASNEEIFIYKGFITYEQYVTLISKHNEVREKVQKEHA